MFTKIELRNFRTHVNTSMELQPITLVIGNNNSGKSNFLAGVKHFSQLIRRTAAPGNGDSMPMPLKPTDFFPYRYRLAEKKEPMGFSCNWSNQLGRVNYDIDLYEGDIGPDHVVCSETIVINTLNKKPHKFSTGTKKKETGLILLDSIENSDIFDKEEKKLARFFIDDLANCWAFHFQPSFLKQWPTGKRQSQPENLNIPFQLGFEGGGLQQVLADAERLNKKVLDHFIAGLRRFESSFFGIKVDRESKSERIMWQFDLHGEKKEMLGEFPPNAVSDGLLKAAAISLLTSDPQPPGMILLEEIENGINPGNIHEFLAWLWQHVGTAEASLRGPRTQIILTSHSPSVLREFGDNLYDVYVMRLNREKFKTITTNLGKALETLISIGSVQGDIIEENDKHRLEIPRHQLTELWYSGSIG